MAFVNFVDHEDTHVVSDHDTHVAPDLVGEECVVLTSDEQPQLKCVCVCGKLPGGMRRVSASVAAERFSGCLRSEYQSRLGRDPRFGAELGSLRLALWACCAGSTMRTAGFSQLSVCSENADVIAEPRLQVDLKVVRMVSLQVGGHATLFRLELLLHESSVPYL